MKYTKGPWRIDQYGEQVHAGNYVESNQVHICNVFSPNEIGSIPSVQNNDRDMRKANALLISAAPEMLEALEKLLYRIEVCEQDAMDNDDPCYELIKELQDATNAIKKAKGE